MVHWLNNQKWWDELTHQERLKKWDWHGIERRELESSLTKDTAITFMCLWVSVASSVDWCVCVIWSLWYSGELLSSSFPKWRNRGSEKLSDFLKNKWQVRSGEAVTIVGMVGGRTYEKLLFHKKSMNTGNNCQRQVLQNPGNWPKGRIYS